MLPKRNPNINVAKSSHQSQLKMAVYDKDTETSSIGGLEIIKKNAYEFE